MNQKQIYLIAEANSKEAREVLAASGIVQAWERAGCRVNLVGSLRMGLLVSHLDIDLHVYSRGITEQMSFAVAAEIAANPDITEIKCINGLHTDEHCIAWHFFYRHAGRTWQIDVIHIEEGSGFDGYFERMADRIVEVMTPAQRDTILRLKAETPDGEDIHGVEYYEAVIADGITTLPALRDWVSRHRQGEARYWIP